MKTNNVVIVYLSASLLNHPLPDAVDDGGKDWVDVGTGENLPS